ncbi:MAG TPA: glycosyltransferase family 1 protein, partial [Promineifilum sp.]|nr:glycosyltransferase family 1 protein [Promineifilum sp.]
VKLAGFVDDADLPAVYSAADLLVFPSLYEGFGLPLLEAMACGTPVISSNASSLPEVATETSAILLSPHDEKAWTTTILRLLEDEHARDELRMAGLARSAQFSWLATARQLAGLYASLLAGENF